MFGKDASWSNDYFWESERRHLKFAFQDIIVAYFSIESSYVSGIWSLFKSYFNQLSKF